MTVRRRLLFSSLAVALVIGTAVGYVLSRTDGGDRVDAQLDTPGVVQDQSIATNKDVAGMALPDVPLYDSDGNEVRSRSLIGQPLVINVWYTECVPCRDELPAFAAVHAELGDQVRFVGVNPRDGEGGGEEFAHELGVRYELLRDPDGLLLPRAGISVFPTTLFVSPDGTIVEQHAGAMTADGLRETITDELLG